MPFNLFTSKIFPVQAGAELAFLTLEQAIRSNTPGQVTHPMGYLATPTRMLAHALAQWLSSRSGGIPEHEFLAAVLDGNTGPVADRLMATLQAVPADELAAFNLFGDSAFMQLPLALFSQTASEPIAGLYQPIRARVSGTAKALRSPLRQIEAVCPSCAAIGVLSTHLFSPAMAQYWGAAPTRGACVYSLQMNTVGASLLANVVYAETAKQLQTLPWLPRQGGNQGFEADGKLPFEHHLLPLGRLEGAAHASLPLIRAVRLSEPTDAVSQADGTGNNCDACGRHGNPLVHSFKLLPEPAVLAAVSDHTKERYRQLNADEPLKASKILTQTLSPSARHPALAYMDSTDSDRGAYPQQLLLGIDSIRASGPPWVPLMRAIFQATGRPAILSQLPQADSRDWLHSTINLFGVRFEGATNPNPRYVVDAAYGLGNLLHRSAISADIAEGTNQFVELVEQGLAAWTASAQVLDYEIGVRSGVKDTDSLQAMRAQPPTSAGRRKQVATAAQLDPVLRHQASRVWRTALLQVYRLADEMVNASATTASIAVVRQSCAADIRKSVEHGWKAFIDSRQTAQATFADLFLLVSAEERFRSQWHGKGGKPARAARPTRLDKPDTTATTSPSE